MSEPDDDLHSTARDAAADPNLDGLDRGLAAAFGAAPPSGDSVIRILQARTGSSRLGTVSLPEDAAQEPAAPIETGLRDSLPGDPHGRYLVLGEIARGGMGVVFRGRDVELGRDVAMKVLHEKYGADTVAVERFIEEAQIGGQLQHPGIVPVYDLGLHAGEQPFFAMKLVKGETLAAQLADRKEPSEDLRRFLGVFEQICQTVAYAHARHIVHRDLKPANVMIGAFGEVQVVDWGFAKVLTKGGVADEAASAAAAGEPDRSVIETVRSGPGSGAHSVMGSMLGTPAYMPPEQARGDVDHMDERSDVFGLGGILCEILIGRAPYAGDADELVQQAARGDTGEALALVAACGANEALVDLCRQCLAPAPKARPRGAKQVAEAIGRYLSSVEERARRAEIHAAEARVKARATLLLSAAAVVILALGGGGFYWVQSAAAARRADAEGLVTRAMHDASVALGSAERSGFDDLGPWRELANAAGEVERLAQSDYVGAGLRGRVRVFVSEARAAGARAEAAAAARKRDAAMRQALLAARIPKDDHLLDRRVQRQEPVRMHRAYRAAFRAYLGGDDLLDLEPERAFARLRPSALVIELAAALDHWALSRAPGAATAGDADKLRGLARRLDSGDRWRSDLRRLLPDAKRRRAELIALGRDADLAALPAVSIVLLGEALFMAGATAEAVAVYARGRMLHASDFGIAFRLGHMQELLGAAHVQAAIASYRIASALRPDIFEAWHRLGCSLERAEQHDEALELFAMLARRQPDSAHWRYHVACACVARGEPERAAASARGALAIDPDEIGARLMLGVALSEMDKLDEAIASQREAVAMAPRNPIAHYHLATVLDRKGDQEAAVAGYRRALAIHPDYYEAHLDLGILLGKRGELDAAIASLRRAAALQPEAPEPHRNLGISLGRQGEYDAARASYDRALALDPKHAATHTARGNTLQMAGDVDGAIAAYRRALEIDPDQADAHANLGMALGSRGEHEAALARFERALALDPNNAIAHLNVGITHFQRGETEAAVRRFRRASALDPRYFEARLYLLVALAKQGETDAAIAAGRAAVALDPKHVPALNQLALLLLAKGELEEAIRCLQRILEVDPGFAPAHVNLGDAFARQEKLAAAAASYGRAQELFGAQKGAFARTWGQRAAERKRRIERRLARERKRKEKE